MKKVMSILVLLVCVSLSNATVILEDNFNAGPLNTAKWTTAGGTPTFSGGGVVLNGTNLYSIPTLTVGAGETVSLKVTFDGGDWCNGHALGLFSANAHAYVTMEGNTIYGNVKVAGGSNQSVVLGTNGAWFEGPVTITISENAVTFTHDWWSSWNQNFAVTMGSGQAYAANFYSGYNNAGLFIDNVVMEVVPEPATIALLGLSGLFLSRKKK